MSTPSSSKAAELAARQVEAIVEAAEAAAEEIRQRGERDVAARHSELEAEFERRRAAADAESERVRTEAVREAQRLRSEAEKQAERERAAAHDEAKRVTEKAQREAGERVAAAEKAADEALADARAMDAGLRRLAESLSEHAERILRDVQTGHKRLRADLRVASGAAEAGAPRPSTDRERPSRRPNPFDDIDVPSWVARDD